MNVFLSDERTLHKWELNFTDLSSQISRFYILCDTNSNVVNSSQAVWCGSGICNTLKLEVVGVCISQLKNETLTKNFIYSYII